MQLVASSLLALSLAAPDPRTIDPGANRPDIVTEGGDTNAPVIPTVPPPATRKTPPPPPPVTSGPPAAGPPAAGPPSTTPTEGAAKGRPHAGGQPTVAATVKAPGPPVDRTKGCLATHGRCRKLSIAGYVALGVGASLLGAGIAFTQIAPFPLEDDPPFSRSLVGPGKAMVGVGVVALLAGGLLVGSGIAVHRKFASGQSQLARVRLDAQGLHW